MKNIYQYILTGIFTLILVASPIAFTHAQTENLEDLQDTQQETQLDQETLNEPIPQPSAPPRIQNEYYRGEIIDILEEDVISFGQLQQPYQTVTTRILNGPDQGEVFNYEYQLANGNEDIQRLNEGDTVVVVKIIQGDTIDYFVAEPYRLPAVIWLFVIFFALAVVFAGKKGVLSLVALSISMGVIVFFILPQLVAGRDPVLISLIGSLIIMCLSLYIAHGFNKRTTVALYGTAITLIFTAIFASFAVWFAQLFGLGSEEAISLLQGNLRGINLQGLLLGAMIIGALGVLDDVTTAQSATVQELHFANPKLSSKELYKRGMSVGREHIASLINTLALAYVGASLPLMLIFTQMDFPLWINLNSEFLVEEIIRTLVGSTSLILAVPLTTWIASKRFDKDPVPEDYEPGEHIHSH